MNAGVGGSTHAAALIAALAVGAGQLGGARELFLCMETWVACRRNLVAWKKRLSSRTTSGIADIWGEMDHPPGFDPNGNCCPTPVRQTLAQLAEVSPGWALKWLLFNRERLESVTGSPLAFPAVIAAAFIDLGFDPEKGEMLYLMLRLPGAAVHALEQQAYGWRYYPFFGEALKILNDPGQKGGAQEVELEEVVVRR